MEMILIIGCKKTMDDVWGLAAKAGIPVIEGAHPYLPADVFAP